MTNRRILALVLAALGVAAPASAQDACFRVTGASGDQAQALVGLHDTVSLATDCRYALDDGSRGEAPGALAGQPVDFLELWQHLQRAGQSAEGDPRVIYATRRGQSEPQTLMLRYCAHYVLEEQLGFRAIPEASSGGLRVERVTPAGCDAAQLELRAAPGVGASLLPGADVEHTLATGASAITVPQGDWTLYAARPGSTVALRVGVFRTQRVVTPLQHHLRRVGEEEASPPLFAARWEPGGPGLLLWPTDHVLSSDLLWPELRTAAEAGVLWLASARDEERPVVVGLVQLEAGDEPGVRLPDRVVRETMRARYGDAADALVPDDDDWRAVFADLSMCLTPSYHRPQTASLGAMVPERSTCASLGGLAQFFQVQSAPGDVPARVCLRHAMQRMTADGAPQDLPEESDCWRLPSPGSEERPAPRVAVAGDRFTMEGHGLCVLVDGAPLSPVEGSEGEYALRAGLLEVRQGGGPGCGGPQAIARLRMPVFDPLHEWHPVGMFAGADAEAMQCRAEEGLVCPWRATPRDEDDVFAYVEPRNELEWRLSTSSSVAAVYNRDPESGRQLSQDVPTLAGVDGGFGGADRPAVVAYVTRDDQCPTATVDELRAEPPLDPDSLLADATFNVLLLAVTAGDQPPTCLARARFRSRPSRAIVAETVENFLGLEVGLLGDTQAVFFANDPIAMGVSLPLAWFRMTPGIRFISLEITASLVMALAFPQQMIDAEPSRVGAALTWAVSFGIPDYLPRILSVGGMLHGAAETSTIDDPIVSFFVGLNLATLVDLAGGR